MSIRKHWQEDEAHMEMTPMIDVTFLLLIFFMCTLKFKVLEGKLNSHLPKDVGVTSMDSTPIDRIRVDIVVVEPGIKMDAKGLNTYADKSGESRHTFRNRSLAYRIGTLEFSDLADVQQRLALIRGTHSDQIAPVVLRPHADAIMGDVIPVLDCAVAAGFRNIEFSGAFEERMR